MRIVWDKQAHHECSILVVGVVIGGLLVWWIL